MGNVYYYDLEVNQTCLFLLSPLAYAVWIEIFWFVHSHTPQWSPLAYAVWIEISCIAAYRILAGSPLAYAVWIEIFPPFVFLFSLPCHRLRMQCGLKYYALPERTSLLRHRLRMRCGLKFLYMERKRKPKKSPLAYAVWIEIKSTAIFVTAAPVTACVCGVD